MPINKRDKIIKIFNENFCDIFVLTEKGKLFRIYDDLKLIEEIVLLLENNQKIEQVYVG